MDHIPEHELYVHIFYNNASNAVRVTHLPTGLREVYAGHRSILRNKEEAVRRLAKRLARP